MIRDNDLIRALGHMVIQASHLEREIEEICCWLDMGFTRPEHHENQQVSKKIKWCKSRIKELNTTNLDSLNISLDKAMNLLEKRNKVVHGQIYFALNEPEKIFSSRSKCKERTILPSEVYDLAESIYNLHQAILTENAFTLTYSLKDRIDS